MAKELKTTINIKAPIEQVWTTLLDFKNHPNWNPFIKKIEGNSTVGSQLKIEIDGMKFQPTVLTNNQHHEFKWLGKLWVNGIFNGEHRFVLSANEDGSTQLNHQERFTGILIPFMSKKFWKKTENGFLAMNEAMKKEVENKAV